MFIILEIYKTRKIPVCLLLCNNTNLFLIFCLCIKKETIIFVPQLLIMIQRIQTIYLLLVAGISAGLIFVFNLWVTIEEVIVYAKDEILYFSLFLASALIAVISIFLFKNRKFQFVLGRLNIILNFILLGLFVYRSLTLSGEASDVSEKGIGILLPIFSIVFLVLANKAIKKDEDLVKSVDRLR